MTEKKANEGIIDLQCSGFSEGTRCWVEALLFSRLTTADTKETADTEETVDTEETEYTEYD